MSDDVSDDVTAWTGNSWYRDDLLSVSPNTVLSLVVGQADRMMSSNATRGVKCWCRLVQLMVQQVWENRWRFWCILVGCTWCVCWPCVCWPWLCPRPQERSEDVAAWSRPWGRTDLFTDDRRTVLERSRRKDQRLLRSSIVTECFHVHFIKDCVEVTVQRLHTDNRGSPLLTSTGSVGRNEPARPIRLQRETTLVTWSFCLFS